MKRYFQWTRTIISCLLLFSLSLSLPSLSFCVSVHGKQVAWNFACMSQRHYVVVDKQESKQGGHTTTLTMSYRSLRSKQWSFQSIMRTLPRCRKRPDGKWKRQRTGSKMYAATGWAMFSLGNALRFVSMRFAAQTVLSGLGSLQFVVIPLASRSLLGIKPQLSTGIGVAIVLIGNLLIIAFGPSERNFTLSELRYQWTTAAMKSFLILLAVALATLHGAWRIIHHIRRQAEAVQRAKAKILTRQGKHFVKSSLGGGSDADLMQHLGNTDDPSNIDPTDAELDLEERGFQDPSTLRMFSAALLFSAVSSFIGAWSVLFSKSLTYVVGEIPTSLRDPYSWFTIAAFLATAAYWIRQSNKGLKLYPATLIMPLMQAFWMAMSIFEGMIYFDETRFLSTTALCMLMLGLGLAVFGAVAMGLSGFWNEVPRRTSIDANYDRTYDHQRSLASVVPGATFRSNASTSGKDIESSRRGATNGGAWFDVETYVVNPSIRFFSKLYFLLTRHAANPPASKLFVSYRKESGLPLSPFDDATLQGSDGVVEEATGRIDGPSSPTLRSAAGSGSLGVVLAHELSLVAQRRQQDRRQNWGGDPSPGLGATDTNLDS